MDLRIPYPRSKSVMVQLTGSTQGEKKKVATRNLTKFDQSKARRQGAKNQKQRCSVCFPFIALKICRVLPSCGHATLERDERTSSSGALASKNRSPLSWRHNSGQERTKGKRSFRGQASKLWRQNSISGLDRDDLLLPCALRTMPVLVPVQ
jgi:hypothetical protein